MSSARSQTAAPSSPGKVLGIIFAILAVLVLVLWLLIMSRRASHEIAEAYGRRRGYASAESVNGTAVLASMFEAAGSRVTTITELGPRTEKLDTIIWAPDSFALPSSEVEDFLEDWLANGTDRTLVYIGRDYDASPQYWQQILQQIPPAKQEEYERRWARAQARVHADSAWQAEEQEAAWFKLLGTAPPRTIDSLDGPWASGVNVEHTELTLAGRLDLPYSTDPKLENSFNDAYYESEILLQSENDLLAYSLSKSHWSGSRVIVIANGGFTLNLPLVNAEHRKLAGRLVNECQASQVGFLESGITGPKVRTADQGDENNQVWRLFTVWPVGFIFVHLAALGIAFSVASFPIFGRPQRLPKVRRSDFGQHVEALGELLRKTRDVAYAEQRIKQYQQQAKRGSGKSHVQPLSPVDQPPSVGENKELKTNGTSTKHP